MISRFWSSSRAAAILISIYSCGEEASELQSASRASALVGGNFVAVEAGTNFACGIHHGTGALYCWGTNTNGQLGTGVAGADQATPAQVGSMFWTSVSAGMRHACGISAGGLYCWGANNRGQLGVGSTQQRPAPARVGAWSDWIAVSAGSEHSCAVRANNTLWCWGNGSNGQVGHGALTDATAPVQVGAAGSWAQVSAGQMHNCALSTAGALSCWGLNSSNQVGDGTTTTRAAPVAIGTGTYTTVSAGDFHTCTVRNDGALLCFGDSRNMQAGAASGLISTPLVIGPGRSWTRVAAGSFHSCATQNDGSLWCFGNNSSNQLGAPGTATAVPRRVGTLNDWTQISATLATCGLHSTGALDCWGSNARSELGTGIASVKNVPAQVDNALTWQSVSAGGYHSCAIKADGTLHCFGQGTQYQLGTGPSPINRSRPVQVGTANDWTQVSSGLRHSCGIRAGGALYCWGANPNGQVTGTNMFEAAPRAIAGAWSAVSTGHNHTCAIRTDGALWCWGLNDFGQLGDNSITPRNQPVQVASGIASVTAGLSHTCAVQWSGQISCSGRNQLGQLGTANNTDSRVFVPIADSAIYIAAGAGASHNCALRAAGTITCWGANSSMQISGSTADASRNTPSLISAVTHPSGHYYTAIASGGSHSCARRSNGDLLCWGEGWLGQTAHEQWTRVNVPRVVAVGSGEWNSVSSGLTHTCAVRQNSSGSSLYCWGDNSAGQLGDGTAWSEFVTDECLARTHGCGAFGSCVDLELGFSCNCNPGYGWDGNTCSDINECLTNNGGCAAIGGTCTNGQGTRACACASGYTGDGIHCADVDECLTDHGGCSTEATCTNTSGSRSCACNAGFVGDGVVCVDLDECLSNNGGCSPNAQCTNTAGSRACACLTGYAGDGLSCTPTCIPEAEVCDGADNDCDGEIDGANTPCPELANAISVCVSGSCQLAACTHDQLDCDLDGTNGCEVDGLNDPLHCGACGASCSEAQTCNDGVCECLGTTCFHTCGVVLDACGNSIDCGSCDARGVDLGSITACAVGPNGKTSCWGYNEVGGLGTGDLFDRRAPAAVVDLGEALDVSLTNGYSCALLADRTVWCWGEVPDGSSFPPTEPPNTRPVQIAGLSDVAAISVGSNHGCAVLIDKTVRCWGWNSNGALGDGTRTPRPLTAAPVLGLTNVRKVVASPGNVCAVRESGDVYCWGGGSSDAGGFGPPYTDRLVPELRAGISTAIDIAASDGSACVLLADGTVRCWGNNSYGQLGDGTTTSRFTTGTVQNVNNAVAIYLGYRSACARLADATFRCWGDNAYNQFDLPSPATSYLTAVAVPALATAQKVSFGYYTSCASFPGGPIRCFGSYQYGVRGEGQNGTQPPINQVLDFPCGGGGTSNVCNACVPTSCQAEGRSEGTIDDGCGGTLYCGSGRLPQLAVGYQSACAILNGEVYCWGANSGSEVVAGTFSPQFSAIRIPGLTDMISVTVGVQHACALNGQGRVFCWGSNFYGQVAGAVNISDAVAVSAGNFHTCALRRNGRIRCWGINETYHLGNNTQQNGYSPIDFLGVSDAIRVDTGAQGTCAIRSNGQVHCSGRGGSFDALGLYHLPNGLDRIVGLENVAGVSVGEGQFSCVRFTDGTIRCVGAAANGQMGNGTTPTSSSLVQVSGINSARDVAAGLRHACAVLSDGTVRCWGENLYGALGDGTLVTRSTPVAVQNLSGVEEIGVGGSFSCARLADQTIRCWGLNNYGQLGDETPTNRALPVTMPDFPCAPTDDGTPCDPACVPAKCFEQGVTSGTMSDGCGRTLICGDLNPNLDELGSSACLTRADGTVGCWGANGDGQLGNGTRTHATSGAVNMNIADIKQVAMGLVHSCVLRNDGRVLCSGSNGNVELGRGGSGSTVPLLVPSMTNVLSISVGDAHSCARRTDGSVWCWGYNGQERLGGGTTASSSAPVRVLGLDEVVGLTADLSSSCALRSNGRVYCWGSKGLRAGLGPTSGATPQVVPNVRNVVSIAGGNAHNAMCAILSDGTGQCWGQVSAGSLGNGTTLSSAVPITLPGLTDIRQLAAGANQICAVLGDGTSRCWGEGSNGEIGDGAGLDRALPTSPFGLSGVRAIHPGAISTCATLENGEAWCWGLNTRGVLGDGTTTRRFSPVRVLNY